MPKRAGFRRVESVPCVTIALPMCHHDVEMLTYLKLAELSQQKRQFFVPAHSIERHPGQGGDVSIQLRAIG